MTPFRNILRLPALITRSVSSLLALTSLLMAGCASEGDFEVSTLLSDGMVLQQNSNVVFHGWALPGTGVTIKTDWNFQVTATANTDSVWRATVATPAADKLSHTITLSSGNTRREIEDVLIGEVWIATGQSNMGMPLIGWGNDTVIGGKEIQASVTDSLLRFFLTAQQYDVNGMPNHRGRWWAMTPKTSERFSAMAYAFARCLRDSLDVPVGIVQCPFGGATSHTWLSPEDLEADPVYDTISSELMMRKTEHERFMAWLDSFPSQPVTGPNGEDLLKDMSLYDEYMTLSQADFSDWRKMPLPGYWENHGLKNLDGVVWFIRTVTIPDAWVGKDLRLVLGAVDDRDMTYVNQFFVGSHQGTENFRDLRNYKVPGNIIKTNKVTISVRVTDERSNGGIVGCNDGTPMRLELASHPDSYVSIEGEWAYRVVGQMINGRLYMFGMPDNKFDTRPNNAFNLPFTLPTVTYNGMVAPLRGFVCAGVLWQSGEADIWKKENRNFIEETTRLTVSSFRRTIGIANLPFVVCQIAPAVYHGCSGTSGGLVRMLQHSAVLSMDENVVLIPTLDMGSTTTLRHPYKIEQGRRIARQVLAKFYGRKGFVPNGPMPLSATTGHYVITVQMDNADDIVIDTSKPTQFEIAGADSIFYPARAMSSPNGVAVFSHMVSDPLFVRYANTNCAEPTVWNSTGIPCPSFRFKADRAEE